MKINSILIEGKESGVKLAIQKINKIANQIEKKYVVNTSDIGKLIGKQGRHIKSIKETFSVIIDTSGVGNNDFEKIWNIIGSESNIDCAIKALDSLKDMNQLSEALKVCVKTDLSMETEVIPNIIEEKILESKSSIVPVTNIKKKLGIIIPIYNLDESDFDYLKSENMLGGSQKGGSLESSIENSKLIKKQIENNLIELDEILDYKIYIVIQKDRIIDNKSFPEEIIGKKLEGDKIVLNANKGYNIVSSVSNK